MKEIKIKTTTRYFAVKNSIFAAIRYFNQKKTDDICSVLCDYYGNSLNMNIDRKVIIDYLGYDFRAKKIKFKREILPGGKLYHKTQILTLFGQISEEDIEKVINE